MDKEKAELWVTRLRSGNYPQTTGRLKNNGNYCCLGVLTEMAVGEGIAREFNTDSLGDVHFVDANVSEEDEWLHEVSGCLPPSVQEWAGMDSAYGEFSIEMYNVYGPISLADANDNYGMTFAQLADIIELHWQEL